MTPFQQLIGGRWVDALSGGTWEVVNPATETSTGPVPFGSAADAALALDAAWNAKAVWADAGPVARAGVLERAADLIERQVDEFAAVTVAESGKPIEQAKAEWRGAPRYLRYAADAATARFDADPSGTVRRVVPTPVGVVGVITAWNFPVYNVVRAVSSALAAGCPVVIRPSEYTPRSAMLLAGALHDAGAPAGVVNLVNGDAAAMGQVFLDDPRCRKISFTGSTRVGRLLIEGAARTVTGLALELGGNAPAIILDDIDVEAVAAAAVTTKLRNCGQVCVAPQRFYVERAIADRFVEAAADAMRRQVIGDGSEAATTVGPLINAVQRDRVAAIVDDARAQGATAVAGGHRPDRPAGFFYEPTLLVGAGPGCRAYDEEVFGPVMAVTPFERDHDVVAAANAVEYGLAAYVHGRDEDRVGRIVHGLEYGMVGVNEWSVAAPDVPFGGMKQSGWGRESGRAGLDEYLEPKAIFTGTAA